MEEKDLDFERINALSKEELEKVFKFFSLSEIEDLIKKMNEVGIHE